MKMTTKRTSQGFQSQELGSIAEETFNDLIMIWLANTHASAPSRLAPDSQKIDFVVELPSLWQSMSSIKTFWQIKSSAQHIKKHEHSEFGSKCFHLKLSNKTIKSLKESARQHDHFYLAFAHNFRNEQPSALRQRPPQERFEWYCIDFSQNLLSDQEENYIVIPVQNKLNLSTFSLLWSSLWVDKFHNSLYTKAIIEVPDLGDIVRLAYPRKGDPIFNIKNKNSLEKLLMRCERKLGADEYSKVSLQLGIGCTLEAINKKLSSVSSLDTIQTYCPESLNGMANLWLFSRSYRKFMRVSGSVVSTNNCDNNLRILPLPDKPENISGLFKVCLWHIVLLYSSLNVKVRIIYRPSLYAGQDHSYYGGGIGYFPWLSMSSDGKTWMIENSVEATNGQHRDFIYEHMNNFCIDPYNDEWAIARNFKLSQKDLRTAPECPKRLFPKEDRFVEYPYNIFSNFAYNSIYSVKPQLSKGAI
jgi:hypothetical protein